jgi:MOSC domain-containing protein YiiM
MSELPKEAYGPRGDESRHLSQTELQSGFNELRSAPQDSGHLILIVSRRADGVRETPGRIELSPEGGVPADRWGRRQPLNPEAQISVMRCDVAGLIANGQPLTVFGDNFFVDLDISAANLPVGSRLSVGKALLEVTPKPHNGCIKFKGRFGGDALHFVNAARTRDHNLRGVYWKVVQAGEASVGAPIRVLARPH